MRHYQFALLVAISFAGLTEAAVAQNSLSGDQWLLITAKRHIHRDGKVEHLRREMIKYFRKTDIDGGGVSRSDYELAEQIRGARERSTFVGQWLTADLDGDGRVAKAEVELFFIKDARRVRRYKDCEREPSEEEVSDALAKLVEPILRADTDGDGIVTFDEAFASVASNPSAQFHRDKKKLVPLSLDADGDGRVTLDEYTVAFERTIRRYDADGNGIITAQEVAALSDQLAEAGKIAQALEQDRWRQAAAIEHRIRCRLPPVPAGAKIALVGLEHGLGMSTVSIGGEDQFVGVTDLRIESGSEQLYLILVSRQITVWRFSGQTDRLAAVVVHSGKWTERGVPRIGVVGLPASRIHAPGERYCLTGIERSSPTNSAVSDKVTGMLVGRPPNKSVRERSLGAVNLPSGGIDPPSALPDAIETPDTGPSAMFWKMTAHTFPGGLVRINPSDVVAPAPVTPYDVLPMMAGIGQLLDEGALRLSAARKATLSDKLEIEIAEIPTEITIVRKIRFPILFRPYRGLRFKLAAGVPEPDNVPKHLEILR